jgi:RimJ/RimL family protein N-acetyltransferase
MNNAFLVADRTYLRPLEREDAPRLVPWFNDAEVIRWTLRYRPMSLADEEQFIERLRGSEHDVLFGIAARGSDALIGVTGLHAIDARNRSATMGIAIGDRSAWGQRHGTEATVLLVGYAFDTLNLNRVSLEVVVDNERAAHIYKRVGFKKEGVLRQSMFRDGRYRDMLLMSMLREEWQSRA